jgi:hypothetical protein
MTNEAPMETETPTRPQILGSWDHDIRLVELPFTPDVVANLLPIGATVLYADPGLGKSMLAQAVEHYIAYGREFGDWPANDPQRCLVIDLEGDDALTQERGFSMTPFGLLSTDLDETRPASWDGAGGIFHLRTARGDFGIDGKGIAERYIYLDQVLSDAAAAGYPFRYVRIDTMRDFIGSKPGDTNAYDWDKKWVTELNQLAKHHGVALLLLHHTNKAGTVSGSQGISASGECTISLKVNPEGDGKECILRSEKTRRGSPFEYAMRMNSDGVWQFDPQTHTAQVANIGLCRKIVDIIHSLGKATMAEIRQALYDATANGVKAALHRLAGRRQVRYYHGAWELTPTAEPPKPGPRLAFCTVCRGPLTVVTPDQKIHPGCEPETEEELEPEPQDAPGTWSARGSLLASIEASRFHPVPVIRKSERDAKPWALMSEQMDGHFSWVHPDSPAVSSQRVAILDRNGSYPSVCNSVPVAANILKHSGALSARGRTAGIYLIDRPVWSRTDIAHPLGKTATIAAEGIRDRIWVTTPHLILLERLAEKGHIGAPHIRDSWTGPVTWSLFEDFSGDVLAQRQATAHDLAAYTEVKASSSKAIRSLWPKSTMSRFWRPDWHQSIEAEAAVRLWAKAFQAVLAHSEQLALLDEDPTGPQAGQLLALANTDAAFYVAPADADATWAPHGVTLGSGYGQMKHVRNFLLADGTEVSSPVTAEQWQARRGFR